VGILERGPAEHVYDALRRWYRGPLWRRNAFNGDGIEQRLVLRIVRDLGIDRVVETGTYLGHTTYFLATEFPAIPIETWEVDRDFYRRARRNLAACPNVRVRHGDSAVLLEEAASRSAQGNAFFYLDAHWHPGWPLRRELRAIVSGGSAVVLIDDFKVPGRPDYAFAVDEGVRSSFAPEFRNTDPLRLPGALELGTIKPYLDPERHTVLFPDYTYEQMARVTAKPRFKNLIGYCVVLQDQDGEAVSRLLVEDDVARNLRVASIG
jgi:hypothetical protein